MKFIKSAGSEEMSAGFPISEVEKGILCFGSISEKIGATSTSIAAMPTSIPTTGRTETLIVALRIIAYFCHNPF